MKLIVELDVADEAIYRGWDGKLDEFMASLNARLEEVYDDHGAYPRRVTATLLDTTHAGDKRILDALIRVPEGREPRLPYRGETQLPDVPEAFRSEPDERHLEHARDTLTMAAAGGIPDTFWATDRRIQRAVETLGWSTEQAREWAESEVRDL